MAKKMTAEERQLQRQIDRLRDPKHLIERAIKHLLEADAAMRIEPASLADALANWEGAQANVDVAKAIMEAEQRSE